MADGIVFVYPDNSWFFANEVPSWLGDDRITLYPGDIEYAEEYQLVVSDSLTYDQLAERLVQKGL
ncbi:hypothetical protein F9U39_21295 [Pectobacterium versatile]|uniref:Uncharacterized protein n=2 Tax=Pectobacterium TaxID=122277 RepID=A0AAW3SYQ9_9GAMM|nr:MULTISPECIES: hypothetical protein [Pectobacterium]MBA5204733.1 hypothetical protein [Pectobacterium aroidearum]MBN3176407.1 hypothetical protein [Pectobacterium parmentieri]MBQ4791962.1 hypothetical protein [Pectobacterium versatile]QHQ23401.1 hypothetical protein GMX10_04410 [Pectobacterium parvum]QRN28922.1 hypothetical protein IG623_16535 [Pectobacterium parmentieri]